MKLRVGVATFIALGLIVAACGGDDAAGEPEKIVFGFVPSERVETLSDAVQPYMDYLTQEVGIPFEGVVTSDYNGLVVAMGTGGADLGAFGPVGYVQAADLYDNIGVLMQSIRFGAATYHGQWMTNDPSICTEPPTVSALINVDGVVTQVDPQDPRVTARQVGWVSEGDVPNADQEVRDGVTIEKGLACIAPIESVAGLDVGFGSATSTSATIYPQLQLIDAGMDPETDINYSNLSPSHVAALEAAYNGDFDIALGFDDSRTQIRKPDEGGHADVGTKLIIFNLTPEIPNDVVAVNTNLSTELQTAIFDATQAFLATEEGRMLFEEIYEWTEIQEAEDSDFDIVRRAVAELGITEG